jgi:hypothetical protein
MTVILALHGAAGAGKSSVANSLCSKGQFGQASLADPIKHYLFKSGVPYETLWGESALRSNALIPSPGYHPDNYKTSKPCCSSTLTPEEAGDVLPYVLFYEQDNIFLHEGTADIFSYWYTQHSLKASTVREGLTSLGDAFCDWLGHSWSVGHILKCYQHSEQSLVVPDIRYAGELKLLKETVYNAYFAEVISIKITREAVQFSGDHASAVELPDSLFDFVVANEHSPEHTAEVILGILCSKGNI